MRIYITAEKPRYIKKIERVLKVMGYCKYCIENAFKYVSVRSYILFLLKALCFIQNQINHIIKYIILTTKKYAI